MLWIIIAIIILIIVIVIVGFFLLKSDKTLDLLDLFSREKKEILDDKNDVNEKLTELEMQLQTYIAEQETDERIDELLNRIEALEKVNAELDEQLKNNEDDANNVIDNTYDYDTMRDTSNITAWVETTYPDTLVTVDQMLAKLESMIAEGIFNRIHDAAPQESSHKIYLYAYMLSIIDITDTGEEAHTMAVEYIENNTPIIEAFTPPPERRNLLRKIRGINNNVYSLLSEDIRKRKSMIDMYR